MFSLIFFGLSLICLQLQVLNLSIEISFQLRGLTQANAAVTSCDFHMMSPLLQYLMAQYLPFFPTASHC